MPVEDHEVHEKVKIDNSFRYGCNSIKRTAGMYMAPDRRYKPDGTYYVIQIPIRHVLSTDCRNFYLWDTDGGCTDCTAPRDLEYAEKMKGLK